MYTPYDYNEALGHRRDSIDERLREGSPVVGLGVAVNELLSDPVAKTATASRIQNERQTHM